MKINTKQLIKLLKDIPSSISFDIHQTLLFGEYYFVDPSHIEFRWKGNICNIFLTYNAAFNRVARNHKLIYVYARYTYYDRLDDEFEEPLDFSIEFSSDKIVR